MSFDAASFAIGRQSGGGGVTVEPLSVTENGTYTAEEGTAYSPVSVNVSQVSGNPNYVETVSGTLANPWGNYATSDLLEALAGYNISMCLSFELPQTGSLVLPVVPDIWGESASTLMSMGFTHAPDLGVSTSGGCLIWNGSNGTLLSAYLFDGSSYTDMMPYASGIDTELVIISHPMAGSLTMAESETFGGNA